MRYTSNLQRSVYVRVYKKQIIKINECFEQIVGQTVRGGEGRAHGLLQGPEGVQGGAGAVLARGGAAGAHGRRRGGGRQLHQEEARVPPAPRQRRRVPAAGARRGRHGRVAGGPARARPRARAALAHAARALRARAQAPLLLHAQEEVRARIAE